LNRFRKRDPALGPPDFHAYVEAFVGGDWYLFDPTGISPITGLIRIGTGRDAADVSFATIFGPVRTGMPRLEFSADEDLRNGVVLPSHSDLAVSTAYGPLTFTAVDDRPTGDRLLRATAFRSSGIRPSRVRRRSVVAAIASAGVTTGPAVKPYQAVARAMILMANG
jgi:hypothetical protein